MKRFLTALTVSALAASTFSAVALADRGGHDYRRGGHGQGHGAANFLTARPDCYKSDYNTFELRFYGETVRTGHQPAVLPLKRTLSDNCRISRDELQNIRKVIVAAQSYSRYSEAWVDNNGYTTPLQYFNSRGPDRLHFDLGRYPTTGRLQVLLRGDLDLHKVVVKVDAYRRPAPKPTPRPQPPRERTYDITCSSKDKNYAFCSAPGLVRGYLVNKHSDASCREGRSFWFTREGVHVDDGCRATFRVTTRR